MRLLCVARDPNPSRAFKLIAQHAQQHGIEVDLLVGDGKDLTCTDDELLQGVLAADHVLVGMSSSVENARIELDALLLASDCNKQISLFADSFGSYARRHFVDRQAFVDCIFIAAKSDVRGATRMYRFAEVIPSGNPLWGDMLTQGWPREKARTHLAIGEEQRLILCPGNKTKLSDTSNANIEWVSQVGSYFREREPDARVLFAMHPGDEQTPEYYADCLGIEVCVLGKDAPATSALVPGMDLVVSACSPTTDLHAVLLGIPVGNVLTDIVADRLKREFDKEAPPLVEQGYVSLIDLREGFATLPSVVNALVGGTLGSVPPVVPSVEESVRTILKALTGR